MNCKICGKPATKPKAMVPGRFVWCSAACWAKEGDLVNRRIRERKPFEWDPRRVRILGTSK